MRWLIFFYVFRWTCLNKQCRLRIDVVECLIWLGFTLFAINPAVVFNPSPAEPGYVLPLHLKKPTDLYLLCLPFSLWIYVSNLDQKVWLVKIKSCLVVLIYLAWQGLKHQQVLKWTDFRISSVRIYGVPKLRIKTSYAWANTIDHSNR